MADDNGGMAELDALIEQLDAMDPEVVRGQIIEHGGIEAALTSLADLARNAEDPEIRKQAQATIDQYQVGFILLPATDDEDPAGPAPK